MKSVIVLLAYMLSCTVVSGELDKGNLDRMKQTVKIDTVRIDTYRDQDRNKFEILRFNTSQYEMDKGPFYMQITVEIKDSDLNPYIQLMRYRGDVTKYEYVGQDRWELKIPHGELSRPRIRAYVIEYGVKDGDKFVPVAIETKNAKTAEEIIERCKTRIEEGVQLMHAYVYRDDSILDAEPETPKRVLTE